MSKSVRCKIINKVVDKVLYQSRHHGFIHDAYIIYYIHVKNKIVFVINDQIYEIQEKVVEHLGGHASSLLWDNTSERFYRV